MLHYQNVYMPVVIETSTCTPAVGVKINLKVLSQAISTYSAPVTLTLKLWWIFFLLFGSPSVWLVQLQRALSSSLFPSHKSDLFFFLSLFFFHLLVVMFSVLKQAHRGKQYTMFECVLTPRLHKAWFPRGKLAFGMFTFCSHFCRITKKPQKNPPFFFPPRCKLDVRWGKTDADPCLKPKEEGKDLWADKQELPQETTESPIRPLECTGHAMCV